MNENENEIRKQFIEKTEVITNYLRQQIKQGKIQELLYQRQIQQFLDAYNAFKSTL